MTSADKFRILVVDDLADNCLLLQALLESEGYEVETAAGGREALSKIEVALPDLVLLDVMMPDMNGYEVTQQIRQTLKLATIPILLVTAHDAGDAIQGLTLGANDFIRKPINFDELLARVKAFLRLSHSFTSSRDASA